IQQALQVMKSEFDQKLSVSYLARSINLSPSRLAHLFKAQMGITLTEYLKLLRMQRARELLEGSWLTVKEITGRVGIVDESHFVRDFKKTYGLTPTQYRAHSLKNGLSEKTSYSKAAETANK